MEPRRAVAKIREFNRFYTRVLGLLDRTILDSDYSLTQVRILFELRQRELCSAFTLSVLLGIDKSYLSRILKNFEQQSLIIRTQDEHDKRVALIRLTSKGKDLIETLSSKSDQQVSELIQPFAEPELTYILGAMDLLMGKAKDANGISVRNHVQSDFAYVIERHKILYTKEYNLSIGFADYVEGVVDSFRRNFDEEWECLIIPEKDGKPVGSIAIARAGIDTAQLRYFLLEPEMRGLGLGRRLIEMALDFCRQKGYRHVFLTTISVLSAARYLYKSSGFVLTQTHVNDGWGDDIQEERWELDLG